MPEIFAVGETILDIIFKDGQPISAKPGGSSFNSAISMGRLGLPVTFIGELGKDRVGDIIIDFLKENNVNPDYVSRYEEGSTAIALAFLNASNDAEYQFYKDYPYQRLNTEFPGFSEADFLLFGSFYALNPGIRPRVKQLLDKAISAGVLILYDPNFRDSHMNERDELIEVIKENMSCAGIVRASNEDMKNIFDAGNADTAWEIVGKYCKFLVYTANAEGVFLRSHSISMKVPVESIKPVSTIGAGDTFNAGLIFGMSREKITYKDLDKLDEETWNGIISTAVKFSQAVCMSYENYLPEEFVKTYRLNNK